MKYFISLLLFAFGMIVGAPTTVHAQRATTMTNIAGDTLTNTDTVDKYLPQVTGGYSGVAIEVRVTKLSGTAAGKAYLYECLTNTAPGASSKATLPNWGFPVDSLVYLDQAVNTKVFKRTAPCGSYYRVMYTSSGTVSATTSTSYKNGVYQVTQ